MALNGNLKWVIGIGVAVAFPTAGAIGGFAVNNYRIGQQEQKTLILENNMDRKDELIIKEFKESNKEVLEAIKIMNNDITVLKTDIKWMRRNHNGNDR